MLLLNAHWEPIEFHFPRLIGIVTDFERLFDTFMPNHLIPRQPQPQLHPAAAINGLIPVDAAGAN